MKKVLFACLAVLASAVTSQAALVDCPGLFTTDGTAKVHNGDPAKLTAAGACQYIVPADSSNVANEANVNAAGFFGFSDWSFAGINQLSVEAGSGTWSIPAVDFATYDYMLTFKDGSDTNLISFRLNEVFSSGGWDTPFTAPPFSFNGNSTAHDVSHMSLFKRTPGGGGGGGTVPEPASMLLLSVGLLGFAARLRR